MAKDTQDQQQETQVADAPVKRGPSTFITLVSAAPDVVQSLIDAGAPVWVELPATYESITGDGAKKLAAQGIFAGPDEDPLKIAIGADGLALQAVSKRMWKPVKVKVEAQTPKLKVG